MASGGSTETRQEGKGKKRKRQSKYLQHSGKKSTISAGVQGFLITCVGGKERQSIKEAISLLDQFYEILPVESEAVVEDETAASPASVAEDSTENCASPDSNVEVPQGEADADAEANNGNANDGNAVEDSEDSEVSDGENLGWVKCRRLEGSSYPKRSQCRAEFEQETGQDAIDKSKITKQKGGETSKGFDELLAAELEELRDPKKARFVGYETGCNGVIFVRMHLQKGLQQKGPKELAEAIVREAAASKQSRSRFCMRLLPIELTCYASTAELLKVAEPLILRHFPKDADSPLKFAVICEARANTNLNKMEFINAVAKLVPEPHSVDLKNPNKTILVQIVKTACAIGVVEDFKQLAKYNLKQLTSPPEVKAN